jgi:hypothetical protein
MLMLHPLWSSKLVAICALGTILMNAIGHPLYFIAVVWHFLFLPDLNEKERAKNLVVGCAGSFLSLFCCFYLHYWNWGIATNLYYNPDAATLMLLSTLLAVATCVLLAGIGYAYIVAKKEYGNFF